MEGFTRTHRINCPGHIIFTVAGLVLLLLNTTRAQLSFDPRISWQTIQMPHTTIIYPQGDDSLAQIVAKKSEHIYLRLSGIFNEKPSSKIWVVFDTSYDLPIDATMPFPNPIVYINPTALASGLGHFDDWLQLVIIHEFTHAVDMQMRHGLSDALGKIIGRLYFPNSLGPQWLTEGIAVYFESALTGGGRAVSPYYDMMLRMAFLEDRVTTPDQNCYFLSRWPGGSSAYVFGQSYYRYIAQKHSPSFIIKMRKRYAGSFIPYRISESVKAATGSGLDEMYYNWKSDLKRHYISQADSIKRNGLTPFRPLTESGYENYSPSWSSDGNVIYYVSNDPDRHQQIRAVELHSGKQWKIKAVNISEAQISCSKQAPQRVFFSSLEWQRSYSLINDIHALDIVSGKAVQLTKGRRARDPAISPRGRRLVYVTQKNAKSALWLYNFKNGKTRRLLTETGNRQFYQPAWSTDGERIALSVWEKGGYQNIWILDIVSGRMTPLLQDKAKDLSPCWSGDDRYIVFSSDRTGVFNLFAYDLEAQQLLQITNLLGGAFDPEISPDDQQIAFSGYSSRGFDICVMDWKKSRPVEVQKVILGVNTHRLPNFVYGFAESFDEKTVPSPAGTNQTAFTEKPRAESYSPLNSLLPRFYIPFISADEKGTTVDIFTYGQDVLNKHAYQLILQYGLNSSRLGYAFDYTNNSFYPLLGLGASRLTVFREKNIFNKWGNKDYYQDNRKEWKFSIMLPYRKIDYAHALRLAVDVRSFSRAVELLPGTDNPYFEGSLNGWQLQYLFSNAHRFSRSISPVEGYRFALDFQQFTKILKSDLLFYQFHLGAEKFLSFRWLPRHVLYISGLVGFNDLKSNKIVENSPQSRIRGFPQFSWRKRMFRESLEYRFPLWEIERSTPLLPIFVKRFHGALFTDATQYRDQNSTYHHHKAAGLELQFDLVWGYLLEGDVKAGIGYPLEAQGKPTYYITFNLAP